MDARRIDRKRRNCTSTGLYLPRKHTLQLKLEPAHSNMKYISHLELELTVFNRQYTQEVGDAREIYDKL